MWMLLGVILVLVELPGALHMCIFDLLTDIPKRFVFLLMSCRSIPHFYHALLCIDGTVSCQKIRASHDVVIYLSKIRNDASHLRIEL